MLHIFISAPGDQIRPGATGLAVPGYEAAVLGEDGKPVPDGEPGSWPSRDRPAAGTWPTSASAPTCGTAGTSPATPTSGTPTATAPVPGPQATSMIIAVRIQHRRAEVEQALLGHPDVAETGVVAAPDPERGTIVKAYVVLRDGVEAGPDKAAEPAGLRQADDRRRTKPTRARSSSSRPCRGPRQANPALPASPSSPPTAPEPFTCQYAPRGTQGRREPPPGAVCFSVGAAQSSTSWSSTGARLRSSSRCAGPRRASRASPSRVSATRVRRPSSVSLDLSTTPVAAARSTSSPPRCGGAAAGYSASSEMVGSWPLDTALDRHEKLMLGSGEAHRARLCLAPVQEAAQAGAERQQVLEVASRHLGHLLTVAPCRPGPRPPRPIPAPYDPHRAAARTGTRTRTRPGPGNYIVLRFNSVANRLACPPCPTGPAGVSRVCTDGLLDDGNNNGARAARL